MKHERLKEELTLTRREAIAAMTAAIASLPSITSATDQRRATGLGLVAYNCAFRRKWMQQRDPKIDLFEPLTFLKHCHSNISDGVS